MSKMGQKWGSKKGVKNTPKMAKNGQNWLKMAPGPKKPGGSEKGHFSEIFI